MPNHCETDINISGPKAILNEIVKKYFNENGELNCDAVIPYPSEYKELDEIAKAWDIQNRDNPDADLSKKPADGFNQGGYEWCCENWGTKWGTYEGQEIIKGVSSISFSFCSAWSPPIPVVNKLAQMYPQVCFKMKSYDGGGGYKWELVYENGEITKDKLSPYRGERGG